MNMNPVTVSHVAKSFGSIKAVQDVSFDVHNGEIFGLLGPNGAGKTTTIRLMLDIFKPDGGEVSILDGPMTEEKKNRIGYMPEERGLYQDMQLDQCLIYLGTLKGLSKNEARERVDPYLDQFDLTQHKRKKVKELSRGMQQKAQIISTVLHDPELLIIDEPFSGLDPVNTQLAKTLLHELRAKGTTIIMSTHMMHQVEALCDRILLINSGLNVLYGTVDEIQRSFSGHAVLVKVVGELPEMPGVLNIAQQNGALHLTLSAETQPSDILNQLVRDGVQVEQFEVAVPTLDEIFIQAVSDEKA
jgi:ABC-2 type transport system ATP-binding protein